MNKEEFKKNLETLEEGQLSSPFESQHGLEYRFTKNSGNRYFVDAYYEGKLALTAGIVAADDLDFDAMKEDRLIMTCQGELSSLGVDLCGLTMTGYEYVLISWSLKMGFEVEHGEVIGTTVLARNTDGNLTKWFRYNRGNDTITIFGNTDSLNLWLSDTTSLKAEDLVNYFTALQVGMQEFVDPEDWQEIADVQDASEDARYTKNYKNKEDEDLGMSEIVFDEAYVSDEHDTTTYYFTAPKSMLDRIFKPGKYPEAIAMEISIEVPTDRQEPCEAEVSISPTMEDGDGGTTDYDWTDVDLPYEEIEFLLNLGISSAKKGEESPKPWFDEISTALEKYKGAEDKKIWSDGNEILCPTQDYANAIADLIEALYKSAGKEVDAITGHYDPAEEEESDDHTGWWYVTLE